MGKNYRRAEHAFDFVEVLWLTSTTRERVLTVSAVAFYIVLVLMAVRRG